VWQIRREPWAPPGRPAARFAAGRPRGSPGVPIRARIIIRGSSVRVRPPLLGGQRLSATGGIRKGPRLYRSRGTASRRARCEVSLVDDLVVVDHRPRRPPAQLHDLVFRHAGLPTISGRRAARVMDSLLTRCGRWLPRAVLAAPVPLQIPPLSVRPRAASARFVPLHRRGSAHCPRGSASRLVGYIHRMYIDPWRRPGSILARTPVIDGSTDFHWTKHKRSSPMSMRSCSTIRITPLQRSASFCSG
jgi:hypothetical protein